MAKFKIDQTWKYADFDPRRGKFTREIPYTSFWFDLKQHLENWKFTYDVMWRNRTPEMDKAYHQGKAYYRKGQNRIDHRNQANPYRYIHRDIALMWAWGWDAADQNQADPEDEKIDYAKIDEENAYNGGFASHKLDADPNTICPFVGPNIWHLHLRGLWFIGWRDRDIEVQLAEYDHKNVIERAIQYVLGGKVWQW